MGSSHTTWNTGFERSYEMRDWQTSSLHMRHNCLLNKDGNALSVVIFGTESVNTKAFVETSS